jgi:Protein of unknown function (DUF1566)
MRHKLLCTLGVVVLTLAGFAVNPAGAATAAGPYYANPSWDQTLPSDTRFIVLSNMGSNAVLDRETGLVWERSPLAPCLSAFCSIPEPGSRTWSEAQARCLHLRTGGRLGWRLPTVQELASLIDGDPANTSNPRLPPGHPFSSNVQSDFYWSATTLATEPSDAWVVGFFGGDVIVTGKNLGRFVWCVRGGQGVDPQ